MYTFTLGLKCTLLYPDAMVISLWFVLYTTSECSWWRRPWFLYFTLCLHCLSSIKLNFSALKLNTLKYCRPAVQFGRFLVVLWVMFPANLSRDLKWNTPDQQNNYLTIDCVSHWCKFDILVCLSSVQTDAKSLANNSQNCWMSNKLLPSFAYPVSCCWELLRKVF